MSTPIAFKQCCQQNRSSSRRQEAIASTFDNFLHWRLRNKNWFDRTYNQTSDPAYNWMKYCLWVETSMLIMLSADMLAVIPCCHDESLLLLQCCSVQGSCGKSFSQLSRLSSQRHPKTINRTSCTLSCATLNPKRISVM